MAKRDSNMNPIGKSRGIRRMPGNVADWESVNGDILKKAIAKAASVGGALRFGYSRDGGAFAVGVYGDGQPYTEFCKPDEDMDGFLQDVIELFESIGDDRATAQNGSKPTQ